MKAQDSVADLLEAVEKLPDAGATSGLAAKARAAREALAKQTVAVFVSGGLIQEVHAAGGYAGRVLTVDYDTDGADDRTILIPQGDGSDEPANVGRYEGADLGVDEKLAASFDAIWDLAEAAVMSTGTRP